MMAQLFATAAFMLAVTHLPTFAQQQGPGAEIKKGKTVIRGTWVWDIETNTQGGLEPGRDLFWQQIRSGPNSRPPHVQRLFPRGGAALTVVVDVPFENLSADDLKKLVYSPNPVTNTSLKPGTVLAVRTAEGNFAKLKVIGYRVYERDIELSWVLFQK